MTKKCRRRLVLELGTIAFLVLAIVLTTYRSWQTIIFNNQQVEELDSKYTSLLEEEKIKKNEEAKLHDEDYLARIAREKYYYSKDDELIIRVIEDE